MGQGRLSREKINEILARLRQGVSVDELAAEHGIRPETILGWKGQQKQNIPETETRSVEAVSVKRSKPDTSEQELKDIVIALVRKLLKQERLL